MENQLFVPDYLKTSDIPNIEAMIECFESCVGLTYRELLTALREAKGLGDVSKEIPEVQRILEKSYLSKNELKINPKKIREFLFLKNFASDHGCSTLNGKRSDLVDLATNEFDIDPESVEKYLFADLKNERLLVQPKERFGTQELILKANLLVVQNILRRSDRISITSNNSALPFIRQARLRGLIVEIFHESAEYSHKIIISGPLSVLQKTSIYGRYLAESIPFLCNATKFILKANLPHKNHKNTCRIKSGDPIFPKTDVAKFHSKLEEKFKTQFSRTTKDWKLERELTPISIGRKIVYPDFTLVPIGAEKGRWVLEIVGFWTQEYLKTKAKDYASIRDVRIILCVDSKLDFPSKIGNNNIKILRFKSRIDPKEVLSIIDSDI